MRWWVLSLINEAELDDFDAAHVWSLVNEVGCRAMQRIMVVETTLESATGATVKAPLLMSDWVDVQEGRYRYLAVDDGGYARIKIVIGEYLACEVIWSPE